MANKNREKNINNNGLPVYNINCFITTFAPPLRNLYK